MVVTPHYLASQVGLSVLQRGGNAVEAAIAAGAAIAVVYPHGNSIGGDNFWLIYNAKDKQVSAINASGRSGSLATVDYYRSRGLHRIPARGYAAANTVPGAVSGWDLAYQFSSRLNGGRSGIAWKDLLQPAIAYASDGIPVSRNQADRSLVDFNPDDESFGNLQRFEECGRIFCHREGRPWHCGEIMVQKDLGRTLELVAEKGSKEFYRGEIARLIVADMEDNDGTLTLEDFLSHTADWVKPITVNYRGLEAYNLPPNTQGIAALGSLNILNNFNLSNVQEGSADYYHLMVEATKEAFAVRDKWVTDPAFRDVPVDRLLSTEAGIVQADRIKRATRAASSASLVSGGDTVWVGVVDREGNAVSLIQSICDGFGSGIVPRRTGVVMQNRGKFFTLDDSSPNDLMPRKRTLHTLIAGMLLKDAKPHLVYGTMGGEGQPQTQTAMVTRIVDYGFTPQEAIEAPRWLQGRFLDLTQPATQLHLEGRVPDSVVAELRRRGHTITMTTDFADMMGHAGAILVDPSTQVLHGGADPRGDGAAVGF
jgi:oxamate amidohydrolase